MVDGEQTRRRGERGEKAKKKKKKNEARYFVSLLFSLLSPFFLPFVMCAYVRASGDEYFRSFFAIEGARRAGCCNDSPPPPLSRQKTMTARRKRAAVYTDEINK